MKNLILFSLLTIVFGTGCHELVGRRGSGNVIPETRTVSGGFRTVEVSGAIDVYVKQDSTSSVKVETDDNLQQYIRVETNGSALEIYTESGINLRPSHKTKVFVSNPAFDGFKVSGASSVTSENEISSGERISVQLSGASEGRLEINAPRVIVDVSGASGANLRGRTKDLEASASGASKIRGYDLLTENSSVDASGASHIEVYASVKVEGEASGASGINYRGNASNNVRTSGASHVGKN
jgi:hypothetical protein